MSPQGTFFPFGLKWKPLSRRHVMISVKTFSPKITTMRSSFMETVYIFDIFYHLRAVNESKSEVWKGKNLCHWGVNCHTNVEGFDNRRKFDKSLSNTIFSYILEPKIPEKLTLKLLWRTLEIKNLQRNGFSVIRGHSIGNFGTDFKYFCPDTMLFLI